MNTYLRIAASQFPVSQPVGRVRSLNALFYFTDLGEQSVEIGMPVERVTRLHPSGVRAQRRQPAGHAGVRVPSSGRPNPLRVPEGAGGRKFRPVLNGKDQP